MFIFNADTAVTQNTKENFDQNKLDNFTSIKPILSDQASSLLLTAVSDPDTLVFKLSQDAYQGNAEFVVHVDGKQIGPAQQVSALRKNGATQEFTFRGDFGVGAHKVSVSFLNDAYNGTAATDRNLYVEGVSLNGAALPNATKALLSAGTAEFELDGSTLQPSIPAGSYTLEGPVWANKTVTWSIDQAPGRHLASHLDHTIDDKYEPVIQRAMQRWDDVSGLNLVQVGEIDGQILPADITIYFDNLNTDNTNKIGFVNYFYQLNTNGKMYFLPGVSVHIQDPKFIPIRQINDTEFTYENCNTTLYQIVLHEIGHALGLGHSVDERSSMFSVVGPENRDLNPHDIAGIQHLYGTQAMESASMAAPLT